MKLAAIDVGTNAVLSLLVDRTGTEGIVVHDEERIAGLGRGMRDGLLEDDAIARARAAIAEAVASARAAGASRVTAVGTSAMRDARNRARVIDGLAGIDRFVVVDGATEAALTFRGSKLGVGADGHELVRLAVDGPHTVLDIGGGSTELAHGVGDELRRSTSIDVGSVRLHGRWGTSDPLDEEARASMREAIDDALDEGLESTLGRGPLAAPLVAVAGTATTLAAFVRGRRHEERVHGVVLEREEIVTAVAALGRLDLETRRRHPSIALARADVFPFGAAILERVAARLATGTIVVSDGGVRFGLAEAMAAGDPRFT